MPTAASTPDHAAAIAQGDEPLSTNRSKAELSSLKRGLVALEYLNEHPLLSASALARMMDLPRTTVRRILDTLVAEGFAEKIPYQSDYRLTPAVARLSAGLSNAVVISHVATPLLVEATKMIGWSLSLATPDGDQMVIQATTDAISPYTTYRVRVGTKLPITTSQSGRLAIAFLPDDDRAGYIDQLSPQRRSESSHSFWLDSLRRIRERGSFEAPLEQGLRRSIACVPIFVDGVAQATLAMSYFSSAISQTSLENHYVPLLKALAEDISRKVADVNRTRAAR